MKELVAYIARALVEHPEEVWVQETTRAGRLILELRVAREDMGRVIGKEGRVVNAMRTLLRVLAEREGRPVSLDVLEP
jgi:predicted RNA-binding protein YlqC (UPF0109 family)